MRELREAVGLTQHELAKAAEVSRSMVSMIERGERGNPSLYVMQWLSTALGGQDQDRGGQALSGCGRLGSGAHQLAHEGQLELPTATQPANVPVRDHPDHPLALHDG